MFFLPKERFIYQAYLKHTMIKITRVPEKVAVRIVPIICMQDMYIPICDTQRR